MRFRIPVLQTAVFFLLSLFSVAFGQQIISSVKLDDAKQNESVTVDVNLNPVTGLQKLMLYYKTSSMTEFRELEMDLRGNYATAIIPAADVKGDVIEYYIKLIRNGAADEYYPTGYPGNAPPLSAAIKTIDPRDQEVIILSPEKGASLILDDFFVSISLLKASEQIKKDATKIFIDDVDVTSAALFADDIIIISGESFPNKLAYGSHTIRVELYDQSGSKYHSVSQSFSTITQELAEEAQNRFNKRVNFEAESRNEKISGITNQYSSAMLNVFGSYKDLEMDGTVYVSSEEKANQQPVNRYTFNMRYSNMLEVNIGDHTPRYPELVFSGKKIRGFSGNLKLGYINVQTSMGEITRGIEGTVAKFYGLGDSIPAFNSSIIDIPPTMVDGKLYRKAELSQFGTYKRNLFAIRPSFGSGEVFQWGLSYVHGIDEISSIKYSNQPKENVVIGTDFTLGIDNQKILLTGQAAYSLYNSNIGPGTFTDADIDSLFGKGKQIDINPEDIRNLRKLLDPFITVNYYINPLNPQELSTLAAEGALTVNYFDNYLKAGYIYRGDAYTAFGNSFVKTDIMGLNVYDRIRLFSNTLFASVQFEQLQDNLKKTKQSTTKFNTLSTSLSYFPRFDFPSLLLGYSKYNNKNDISATDTNLTRLKQRVDDNTNRIQVQASYDIKFIVNHQTSIGYATSVRDDNGPYNNDGKQNSINFSTLATWNSQLNTYLSVVYNKSVVGVSEFKYTSVTFGGKMWWFPDKFATFGSINPSFGDFKRLALDANGQYYINKDFSIVGSIRYLIYGESTVNGVTVKPQDDVVFGASVRYFWQ